MRWVDSRSVSFALSLLTSACGGAEAHASAPPSACPDGGTALVSDTLYFGTEKRGPDQSWVTVVTPEVWDEFVKTELTVAFPMGSTSWAASGTWKSPEGIVVAEGAYVLTVVHPEGPDWEKAFDQVIESYKAKYEQQSVLRVYSEVCARFYGE